MLSHNRIAIIISNIQALSNKETQAKNSRILAKKRIPNWMTGKMNYANEEVGDEKQWKKKGDDEILDKKTT